MGHGEGIQRRKTEKGLRVEAAKHGLKGRHEKISLLELAARCLEISENGLWRRNYAGSDGLVPDETHFLDSLKESLEAKASPAEELLEKFRNEWDGDLGRIYDEYCY